MSLFALDPFENLLPFDGDVNYFGSLFTRGQCKQLYHTLFNEIHWESDQVQINGKMIQTKRQVSWHGDSNQIYRYSGSIKHAKKWTDTLLELKAIVEAKTGESFNSCLLNYYADGEHQMAWHSDNEQELGSTPVIASLSLGATRKFSFKHKQNKHTCSIELEDGGLMIMKGDTQQHWLHSLPADVKCRDGRINLTFRVIDHAKYNNYQTRLHE